MSKTSGVFNISAADLCRALRSVVPFAETDLSRAHLACVHFRCVAGRLNIVATNGHALAVWRADVPHSGRWLEFSAPLSEAKRIMEHAKIYKAVETLTVSEGHVSFPVGLTFATGPDPFPPYTKVVPRLRPTKQSWIGLSTGYMAKVASAFKHAAGDGKAHAVRAIFGESPLDPIVFEGESARELLVVLMPMRVNDPAWAKEEAGTPQKLAA
jgi:hypothetical protein